MADGEEAEGIRFLDHTADVGIDVQADTAALLFHRAALGMLALLRGDDDPSHPSRPLRSTPPAAPISGATSVAISKGVRADDDGWAAVLASWLRELLFLHGAEGKDYVRAEFQRLDPAGFDATVQTEPTTRAVREIKGVTYHDLNVEEADGVWTARVIFDV